MVVTTPIWQTPPKGQTLGQVMGHSLIHGMNA